MLTSEDAKRAANQQTFDLIRARLETVIGQLENHSRVAAILELKYIVDFIIPKGK